MEFKLTAPCHFGLEACTKREISELGYEISEVSDGRVSFRGDAAAIARSNVFLRTAERVLLQVCSVTAFSWDELFESVYNVPWEEFIPWNGRFFVAKASSVRSKLFSPRDFQTIIQKAIVKRLQKAHGRHSERLPMDGAVYALRVSAYKDVISIGLDTSGESLHRRGYRQLAARAPITETLAAALLMLTPFGNDRILIDPFCGSGTFCIEAAMTAARIAPGMERDFAATKWQNISDKKPWYAAYDEARELKAEGLANLGPHTDIQGYDIDPEIVRAAMENARMAGVRKLIHFQQRDVKKLSHSGKYGLIVTNPPYGERMEEKADLPELYGALGERFRALDSFSLYLITAYEDAERALGMKAAKNRKVYNGMMKAYFYSFPGPKPPARHN